MKVIEPPFFSNWADLFMPRIAYALLPLALKAPWLTPNVITVSSFLVYVAGCLLIPFYPVVAAILLPLAYIGDCLDGQVARARVLSSPLGNYLDKTLDVLKIYVITASLAYAAFSRTGEGVYIFLGFTACFFFNFRYYIKLETIVSQCDRDRDYLAACRARRQALYAQKTEEYAGAGWLRLLWLKHRSFFWLDEAEFVVLTSLACLTGMIEEVLWLFAAGQVLIALWRLAERGWQTHAAPEKLLDPMRK